MQEENDLASPCDKSARCVKQFCGLYRAHTVNELRARALSSAVRCCCTPERARRRACACTVRRARAFCAARASAARHCRHPSRSTPLAESSEWTRMVEIFRQRCGGCMSCTRVLPHRACAGRSAPRSRGMPWEAGGRGSLVSTGTSMRSCGSDSSSGRGLPLRRPAPPTPASAL